MVDAIELHMLAEDFVAWMSVAGYLVQAQRERNAPRR